MSEIFPTERLAKECAEEVLFLRDTVFSIIREAGMSEEMHRRTIDAITNDVFDAKVLKWLMYYIFNVGLEAICRMTLDNTEISQKTLRRMNPTKKLRLRRKINFFIIAVVEAYNPAYISKKGTPIQLTENMQENCNFLRKEVLESFGLSGIRLNAACAVHRRH